VEVVMYKPGLLLLAVACGPDLDLVYDELLSETPS